MLKKNLSKEILSINPPPLFIHSSPIPPPPPLKSSFAPIYFFYPEFKCSTRFALNKHVRHNLSLNLDNLVSRIQYLKIQNSFPFDIFSGISFFV